MSIDQIIKEHQTEFVDVKDLKLNINNPNVMTSLQEQSLEYSLEKYGNVSNVIIDQDNNVIDGAHRVRVYLNKKIPQIKVIRITFKDEQEKIMLSRVLNLLRGKYDNTLNKMEIKKLIGKKENLVELMRLTAIESKDDILNLLKEKPKLKKQRGNDDTVTCPFCNKSFKHKPKKLPTYGR
jgi:hypothetical protein